VATTSILGDIVRNVVGEHADLEVLLPVGADPHDFQLSSREVSSMAGADLVVVNGLRLEEGMTDALEAVEADGANLLEVAPLLDPIPFGAGQHHDEESAGHLDTEHPGCDPALDEEHGAEGDDHSEDEHSEDEGHAHAEGSCDPHFWTDPIRVGEAARMIAAQLTQIDGSSVWNTNAEAYIAQLNALDEEIRSMLDAIPEERRKVVTNHDAFGYFADRYGFEVIGTVFPSGTTLADPSSAELAGLVELMASEGVTVIFAENIEPAALAEAVAAEAGSEVEVVELYTDSLGPEGSGAETIIGMLRTDAQLIADSLG
jgi:zinc/manganese transport system substrate-binding protein